jgi:hypothetical protein
MLIFIKNIWIENVRISLLPYTNICIARWYNAAATCVLPLKDRGSCKGMNDLCE